MDSLRTMEFVLGNDLQCKIIAKNNYTKAIKEHFTLVIFGGSFCFESNISADALLEDFVASNQNVESLYQKLSGPFGLLLIDHKSNNVTIVNDHFAIQPCFYTLQHNHLYISDSLKVLKNVKEITLSISEQALFNYMYFHCIPSPNTIFEQVFKLEPSKAITIDDSANVSEKLFFKPKFSQILSDPKGAQAECLKIIDKAVAKHSSENSGAFLSGGLDSSTVAGMMAKHQTPAKTFSIGFDIKDYDESPYAQLTAEHFSTQHEVLYLQPEQAAEEFINVAQYFDEPFGNSSALATYFCAKFAKSHGVNCLLAGDGGDELFAGNERYAKQKIFEVYQQIPKSMQRIAKSLLCQSPLGRLPLLSKGASYINQAEIQLPDRLESYNFFNRLGIENMFNADFLSAVDIEQPLSLQQKRFTECSSEDIVDKMLYLDWKFTLADNDLVKVGRMCDMANVEVRYPLLDKTVLDFSCLIPADVKLPGNKLRDFYKQSCRGFLVDETITKSKHGFGLPFGVWLKDNKILKELTHDSLLAFKKRKIVKDSLVDNVIEAHRNVHASYYGELIWIMVVLELWLQKDDG